tara:strand:- start:276 stop:887 length:612 start_codon:yes stop_codon:yes gene_type:complete
MKTNNQTSLVKLILEIGPVLVFFLCYKYAPIPENFEGDKSLEQIIFATKVFIPVIFISLLIGWLQTKEIAKMPLFTALIILIFGGLTIWLRDETFIKMKPTILYFLFALILGFGLFYGRSYLQYIMDSALPMTNVGWLILTRRFVVFFVILGISNELIWRFFTTDTWVNFKTFGLPAAMFIFFFAQAGLIKQHFIENNDQADD